MEPTYAGDVDGQEMAGRGSFWKGCIETEQGKKQLKTFP
jgi:hypothetical protein